MTAIGRSRMGQRAGRCWDCGGPCLTYKGSTHGWRCAACCTAYLDTAWAAWVASEKKEQSQRASRFRAAHGNRGGTDPKGGRGGGGLATGRTATTITERGHR